MTDPVCEYCNQDPCICLVPDVEDDGGGPDERTCIDADEPSDEADL